MPRALFIEALQILFQLKFGVSNTHVRTAVLGIWTINCSMSEKEFRNFLEFWWPSGRYSLSVLTVGRPDVSIYCLDIQVVGFFLSFPTTSILSQSDTRAESYDKNTEMCA
jgi:hypothetical protein